ncbi:hypothetical protein SAMN04489711_1306 [Paracidovorax wautersii]|uniref:Uncharacterized protein n=2 Tax=Paracidovorax wautersii TaxID=1177982 RepID=A0A1I2HVG4_9BURK|nr:hypothetical protein SAMN04489711_1306 [Paracidovorax wautersii]
MHDAALHKNKVEELRILGTWGKTQGIYRFDPSLMEELIASPLEGDLPAALLRKLPEWAIYIELNQISFLGDMRCRGAWVMNDFAMDNSESQHELSLLFDIDSPAGRKLPVVAAVTLPLGSWSLDAVMAKYRAASLSLIDDPIARGMGLQIDAIEANATVDDLARVTRAILSLTLFIATQNDIQGNSGDRPTRPEPRRTKTGTRLFSPSNPQVWEVGVRMGGELRRAKELLATPDGVPGAGGALRPHLRRPHWHSYRVGPRKTEDGETISADQRDLVVHFIPSLQVNFAPGMRREDLPAVVHRVRTPKDQAHDDSAAPGR